MGREEAGLPPARAQGSRTGQAGRRALGTAGVVGTELDDQVAAAVGRGPAGRRGRVAARADLRGRGGRGGRGGGGRCPRWRPARDHSRRAARRTRAPSTADPPRGRGRRRGRERPAAARRVMPGCRTPWESGPVWASGSPPARVQAVTASPAPAARTFRRVDPVLEISLSVSNPAFVALSTNGTIHLRRAIEPFPAPRAGHLLLALLAACRARLPRRRAGRYGRRPPSSGCRRTPRPFSGPWTGCGRAVCVLVSPGVYRESVTVSKPRVVLRGTRALRRVVVDGEFERSNGITVTGGGLGRGEPDRPQPPRQRRAVHRRDRRAAPRRAARADRLRPAGHRRSSRR